LLKQAAEQEGPLQLRARYLYALVLIDQNKYEEAEAVLRQIMVMPLLERGMEELRLARFALVHVLFKREAYADAADYLEKALATDPEQPQLIATRYWLAEAYRRAARQDRKSLSAADSGAAREFYVKQKRLQLEKARDQFAQVIAGLQRAASQSPLATEEAVRLRESRLGLGEALTHLGRYDEAADAYRAVLEHEPPSLASVTAAMHLTQCLLTLKQLDEARQSAARGLEILGKVSDRDLEAAQTDRAAWQEWFKNATASTLPPERAQEGGR
jgi:tetratricopeptide (TPR) repeat protein